MKNAFLIPSMPKLKPKQQLPRTKTRRERLETGAIHVGVKEETSLKPEMLMEGLCVACYLFVGRGGVFALLGAVHVAPRKGGEEGDDGLLQIGLVLAAVAHLAQGLPEEVA